MSMRIKPARDRILTSKMTGNTITKIEAIETSDNIIGWGESTLEGHTEAIEGAFCDLRERFVGAEADNIQDIWQTAYMGRFYRGGPVLMSALSGLDIALWDIKGKKLGVPVWQVLGGKVRERVNVYGSIRGDHPSEMVSAAEVRKAQGFTVVKMKGTDATSWIDSSSFLQATADCFKQVKSVGLDVGVDFHGRLHKGMAKQFAKLLEPLHPMFIEEPLLPTQPEEIADLANAVSTPIALGERLYSRFDFRPYLERRAIDIAQPDVSHCGGISELHRIASYTETYDVGLAPHCPLGPIALAACMQVAICAPNFMHYNVTSEDDSASEADLHTYMANPEVFTVKEGYVTALQGPGIGVEIDEERVRRANENYVHKSSPWRNPVCRGEDGGLREW
ncbi:enolase C-terminal domain-like protein [Gymnopus androsaceus JB14]|uniref:Enolase C-terminal domain-like protein n=1 Tax=Gymnopus androsaceus JB14 TaxID=1447944 RepID=A0A6A4I328_9AGAR|nr:enolase C-terminal domain-like protein [Gymnopus androsaceus JB14]